MRIKIVGAGLYGCHLGLALLTRGHIVEIHEKAPHIFAGASGSNPARGHLGFHYPRSRLTRAACQEHFDLFMQKYGKLTHCVPINIYAVAESESLVDFGTYCQILKGEVEFITIYDPGEFGLQNVEGAVLTGERHLVVRKVRAFFEEALRNVLITSSDDRGVDGFDFLIDATFCANDSEGIDRFEPCMTVLLEGPTDRATTVMDGGFPSLFPWDEEQGLSSLTSAKLTPFKRCASWEEANSVLQSADRDEIAARANAMLDQMSFYWCGVRDLYRIAGHRFGIRAMPKSGCDARLIDIIRTGERSLRVRAGKIDAIIHAERVVCEMMGV